MPAVAFLDTIVFPEGAPRLLSWHVATFCMIALLQGLLRTPLGRRAPLLLGMAVPAALGVDAVAATMLVGREATPSYAGMILALLAASLLLPWSPGRAAALSLLLVGGYVGAIAATGEVVRITLVLTNTSLLVGTAVFVVGCAIAGARRRQHRVAADAQARRQAALAKLGQLALASEDRVELTRRAAAFVADALGVTCTAFFDADGVDDRVLLRAGAGWHAGLVGSAKVEAGAGTFVRRVLEADGEPVVSDDLGRERRFTVPGLLRNHELVAGAAITVASAGRCFGVLGAFAARRWACTPAEAHFLKAIAEVLTSAMLRLENAHTLAGEAHVATALARVGRELISSLDAPVLLERLCQLTTEVLGADHSETWLLEPEDRVYVPISGHGFPPATWDGIRSLRIPAQSLSSLMARVSREDVVQVTAAAHEHPFIEGLLAQFGSSRALFVALRRGDEIIGVQATGLRGPSTERFTRQQEQLAVGIAQLASMALTNARLVEALERASQLKSEFVSTMSHELRTPLNVIIGYLDMLSDQPASAEQAEILGRVRASGLELLDMIESTLNLNRIQAGQDIPQFAEFRVDDLWEELRTEFSVQPRKTEAGLRWEPLRSAMLYSDRRRLKIILKNLVGNALKFTPTGEVVVRCERRQRSYVFSVTDSGIGIPASDLPMIFDMFRQVDSSESRSYSGAGLGLYIVKRLLDQLGGEIEVESEPGRGSAFRVTLPIEPVASDAVVETLDDVPSGDGYAAGVRTDGAEPGHVPAPPTGARAQLRSAEVAGGPVGANGGGHVVARGAATNGNGHAGESTPAAALQRNPRILYADDLEVNRHVMRRFIARQFPDVEVYEACDGLQALALFEAHRPDLVLLDLRMPTMDGWMAARRIRTLEGGRDVPILAITVTASPGAEAYALHAGCDEFIPKPISDYGVLLARIGYWLTRIRVAGGAPVRTPPSRTVGRRPEQPAHAAHGGAMPHGRVESVRSPSQSGARRPSGPTADIVCVLCRQPLPTSASAQAYEKQRAMAAAPLPRA